MLTVRNVTVRFGTFKALHDVDLDVADGAVVALLGPSGCGKTTLLRFIAGLQSAERGLVAWNGEDVTAVPAHQRRFGLMFQDYALFPHKNVSANVAFGLRMAGLPAPEIEARVGEALVMVGLEDLGDRSIGDLSGGEQQRVALARALAPSPRLLMLDEPIGALDRTLRERLMVEMRELFGDLGIAVLYVTHDQEEAFAVADHLVVMRQGRVEQRGEPEDVWRAPATTFVARFLGFTNILEAEIRDGTLVTGWANFPVGATGNGAHTVVLRPDALAVDADGPIRGTVTGRTFRGGSFLLEVRVPNGPVLDVLSRRSVSVGSDVALSVDPDGVAILGRA